MNSHELAVAAVFSNWQDVAAFLSAFFGIIGGVVLIWWRIYTAKAGATPANGGGGGHKNGNADLRALEKEMVRLQNNFENMEKNVSRIERSLNELGKELRSVIGTQGNAIATIHGILRKTLSNNDE